MLGKATELDHLPEVKAEDESHKRQIYAQNIKRTDSKLTMEFKKGQLMINNEPYRKKIANVGPRSLINTTFDSVNRCKTLAG